MTYIPDNKKAPEPTTTQDAFLTNTDESDYPSESLHSKCHSAASRLVLAGFTVQSTQGGGFNVIRIDWGQCRHCKDEAELVSFAQKLGVQK